MKLCSLEMFQYLWELCVWTVGFSQLDTESLQDQTNIPALSSEANKVHQYLHSSEPMRHKTNGIVLSMILWWLISLIYIMLSIICKLEFQKSVSANLYAEHHKPKYFTGTTWSSVLPASHPGSQDGASCATAAMVVLFPQPGGPSRRMGLVFDCSTAFFTSARKACLKVQPSPLRDGGKSLARVETQLS